MVKEKYESLDDDLIQNSQDEEPFDKISAKEEHIQINTRLSAID
jgi:hypothetical protein